MAAAAYRAGEKLTDKNKYNPNAMVHDYSKKSDIMHKNIILPAVLAEQDFKIDRENLWSMVEEHEVTKKDKTLKSSARVAREWLLALPHELSDSENIALAEEFATKMANDLGVIADCCIHNPKLKSNVPAPKPSSKAADNTTDDDDERNIHAHIMFTTRKAELNTANQLIFTDKADSELDGTARKAKGLVKETEYIKTVRAEWAEMINKRLLEHGIKAVSSLSYKDRKLDVLPQVHIGRSPLSDRKREHNDEISERNESVFNSRAATVKRFADRANGQSATTDRYLKRASRTIGYNERVTSHLDKGIKYSKQRVEYSERLIEKRASKASNPFSDAIRRSSAARESAAVSYNRETEAFDRTTDETTSKLQKYSGLGNK
ncbi:MobA/MobL family protein, partial [Marinobacter sp. 1Y8]